MTMYAITFLLPCKIYIKSFHIVFHFSVDSNFDVHDIPMDVIWLDIEHTDGKRYIFLAFLISVLNTMNISYEFNIRHKI